MLVHLFFLLKPELSFKRQLGVNLSSLSQLDARSEDDHSVTCAVSSLSKLPAASRYSSPTSGTPHASYASLWLIFYKMETFERPAKVQKTDHVVDAGEVGFSEAMAADQISTVDGDAHVNDQPCELGAASTSKQLDVEASTDWSKETPKISKNQLKKQRRQEAWDAKRDERKIKRKEKAKAKRERKCEEKRQQANCLEEDTPVHEKSSTDPLQRQIPASSNRSIRVPMTVVFDCSFDDYMLEQEIKSLSTQITRCYSDNRSAPFRVHLAVASFGGRLKERHDVILNKQYQSWSGFHFLSDDFVTVSDKAEGWMEPDSENVSGALASEGSPEEPRKEIVYLSSESDVTLERLHPNSTYIIGGLVDRNRHKGLCFKRAKDRGIRTAKLPIGDFMEMNSRQVLATNHVLEIMLKWLETGSWAEAFMEVIPKRKGGSIKQADKEGMGAGADEAQENTAQTDQTHADKTA